MIKKGEKKNLGITLIELLVSIGILIILTSIFVAALGPFQKESDLNNTAEGIINALRLAQNETLSSDGDSQYGVYFDKAASPHQYILFRGGDFASRDDSFDKIYKLAKSVEISEADLSGGQEVIFNRIEGTTNQPGSVSLRLKSDFSKNKNIYVEESGRVGLSAPAVPSDENRLKDSRHLHFDYSRLIDTASESLTLASNFANKEILIADCLKDGQIYWEGEILVEGEAQKLKIQTHKLNSPDTQFSIRRDRRYNSKPLIITISGDASGSLVEYSADGLAVDSASIYVNDLVWQ